MGLEFQNPILLWLLILVPLYAWLSLRREKDSSITFSSTCLVDRLPQGNRAVFRRLPLFFKLLALILLVLALSRPRQGLTETRINSEGVDIMISLDVSGSMEAQDFKREGQQVDRLDISKQVIEQFIKERAADRIGLVVFATHAYTQCPLTVDYAVLEKLLSEVKLGIIDGQSTAIGSAIASALNRLRSSEAKSKVIILLTDGNNNAGKIDPETAAQMAKTMKVKIYAIGVGGEEPFRYRGDFGRIYTVQPLNDEPLIRIADITGGQYFRATDSDTLKKIFSTIDRLEKTSTEAVVYTQYRELFPWLLFPSLFLLLLGTIIGHTVFRRLP